MTRAFVFPGQGAQTIGMGRDLAAAYPAARAVFAEVDDALSENLSDLIWNGEADQLQLTRNAQPIDEGDRADPAQAVLWGMGRTIRLEHPEIWAGIVDVDESAPAELVARILAAESRRGSGEGRRRPERGGRGGHGRRGGRRGGGERA